MSSRHGVFLSLANNYKKIKIIRLTLSEISVFLAFILVFSIVITSEFEGGLIRAVITGLIVSQVLLILNDGILHNVVDPGLHFFQQILFNLVNVQVVVFLVMR